MSDQNDYRPYYGRERRDGRDRRLSRGMDKRRSHTILPPISLLERYDASIPGFSDMLMDLVEKEQTHRHAWEEANRKSYGLSFRLGQLCGLIFALTLLFLVFSLVTQSNYIGASIISGVSVFAIVLLSILRIRRRNHYRPYRPHYRNDRDVQEQE